MTLEEEIISFRLRELETAAHALLEVERTGAEPHMESPGIQMTIFDQAAEAWAFQATA